MSRGAGRVERSIDLLFRSNGDQTFSTDQVVAHIFGQHAHPTKAQRVSVLRAAKRVCRRVGWASFRQEKLASQLIFHNPVSLQSYAVARLRACFLQNRMALTDIESLVAPGGKSHKNILPGGCWWNHVEQELAIRRGDHARAEQLEAENWASLLAHAESITTELAA